MVTNSSVNGLGGNECTSIIPGWGVYVRHPKLIAVIDDMPLTTGTNNAGGMGECLILPFYLA